MRLPALWLTLALAAGALCASGVVWRAEVWLALCAVALLAAFAALRRNAVRAAWGFALLAWLAVGGLASACERDSMPAHHVTRLLAEGRLDTSEPLRWRGVLRSDPVLVPWGARLEVDLDEVELAGTARPIAGGLRGSYYADERRNESLPAVRAGDRVELLLRARLPRNFLNPGSRDIRAQLARQNIHLTGTLRSPELFRLLAPQVSPSLAHRFARLRGHFLSRLNRMLPGQAAEAAVLRAMLLGDYTFLDRDVSTAFQKTSVYHVLVISGMHVAILAGAVWWLCRRLRLPPSASAVVILLVLAMFAGIVEERPPITRAGLMTAMLVLAQLWFRKPGFLNVIALAASVLLLARPSVLTDPSFQLSFLAAAIIGGLVVPLLDRSTGVYRRALQHLTDLTRDASHPPRAAQFRLDLRAAAAWLAMRLPSRLAPRASAAFTGPCRLALRGAELAAFAGFVQFGMIPVMAQALHRVSIAGPVANFPAALLSGAIVPLGFLALLLDAIWPALGGLLAKAASACVSILIQVVNAAAAWPWGAYRIPAPPAWVLALFYLTLLFAVLAASRPLPRRRDLWLAVPLVLLAALAMTHPFSASLPRGTMEATVLDVGQGDSVFVALPDGVTLLVDGGGNYGAAWLRGMRTGLDIGESVVSPYLWSRGVQQISVVALTHAHGDHLEGLHAVLDNFRVGELWYGRAVNTPAFHELLQHARQRGVTAIGRHAGEEIALGGATVRVLWPEDSSGADRASNNDSLVLRAEYAGHALLLTGDIEAPVEAKLASDSRVLPATFLKAPHHASRTSSTPAFLAAVKPVVAAASFGENNPFGFPHCEVIQNYRLTGTPLLRTDRDGAITVRISQQGLHISSFARDAGWVALGAPTTPCLAERRAKPAASRKPREARTTPGASKRRATPRASRR